MNKLRYFRSHQQAYETTRIALDASTLMPHGETVYEPLATAPKASNGDVLIAIRSEHCDIEPYASAIASLLGSNAVTEITQLDYEAAVPPVEALAALQS